MLLNALQSLGLSAGVILLGEFLKRKSKFLSRYSFPSPVIGGLLAAIVFMLLKRTSVLDVKFDLTFQEPLMIAFFASLGFAASWNLLKAGGRGVIRFLILCTIILLLQAGLGIVTAFALGVSPLMGLIASCVSLAGGPGTALAFAPLFENAGVHDAKAIGLACALSGILIGGLLGTPIASRLIQRFSLRSNAVPESAHASHVKVVEEEHVQFGLETDLPHEGVDLLKHILAFAIILGLGTALSELINRTGITLPIYIGSMIVAAIFRNLDDRFHFFKHNEKMIDDIGSACLALFVGLSAASLDFSQLHGVLLIVAAFHFVQTLLIGGLALTVVYRVMGRDYDAAVISGGFVGFMMGTTANAMVNMNAITAKSGPARRAYLVVPLVGACFIDFVNAALITLMINFLK